MKVIEEPQLAVKRKFPWFIDVLLYPASASGVIHLVVFWLTPFLISLLNRIVLSRAGCFGAIVTLGLYVLFIGYVFYYIAYCVFDSAKGGRRAPNILSYHTPDKADLISQLFLILGSVAVCFCPAAIYYILTERIDLTFWVLAAGGIFLFPMALLTAVMFDSADALNPVLIIRSILKTFFTYCALVLFFCVIATLAGIIISNLPRPETLGQSLTYIFLLLDYLFSPSFVHRAIAFTYLAMVGAHLLGCFYWWHKDKLDWGI